jgi:hypothetical protein
VLDEASPAALSSDASATNAVNQAIGVALLAWGGGIDVLLAVAALIAARHARAQWVAHVGGAQGVETSSAKPLPGDAAI